VSIPTPWLDDLAEALSLDWHRARVAGRVQRHVQILRDLAHQLGTDPERVDRPRDAAEAETQFWDFLGELARKTPRLGLSARTAAFVDHLIEIAGRYGAHLFFCFDDPALPATTNQLEGFFGLCKRMARRALGTGSTTHSLVHNLDAEVLLAWHQVRAGHADHLGEGIDLDAYRRARQALRQQEQPARQRRSFVRHLDHHLDHLLARWLATP
jgi:hypothetical protein